MARTEQTGLIQGGDGGRGGGSIGEGTGGPGLEGHQRPGGVGGGRGAWSRVRYWVEPVVFLYHFGYFGFGSLNSQYINYRVEYDLREAFAGNLEDLRFLAPLAAEYRREKFANATSQAANLVNSTIDMIYNNNTSMNTSVAGIDNITTINFTMTDSDLNSTRMTLRDYLAANFDFESYIGSTAAEWVSFTLFMRNIPGLFMLMVIVAFSDAKGRKYGVGISCLGLLLKYMIYVIVEVYKLPLGYLGAANFMEGLLGGHGAFAGAAFAYCCDVVPPKSRGIRFGIVLSCQLLAGSVSNLLLGILLTHLGYLSTIIMMTFMSLASLLWVVFLLAPPPVYTEAPEFSCSVILDGLKSFWMVLFRERKQPYGRLTILWTLGAMSCIYLSSLSLNDIESLYLIGKPFYLSPITVGYFLSALGFLGWALAPGYVFVCTQLGISDIVMIIVSCCLAGMAFVIQSTISNAVELFLLTVLFGLGFSFYSISRNIISAEVEMYENGAIQGAMSIFQALGETGSGPLLSSFYGATLATSPHAVLIFMGVLSLLASFLFVVLYIIRAPLRKKKEADGENILSSEPVSRYSSTSGNHGNIDGLTEYHAMKSVEILQGN